jgi:hypothetical protein
LLGARLCDLAAHILEEVLREALLLCHDCDRLLSSRSRVGQRNCACNWVEFRKVVMT